ncbi:predicted protein [Sclerotinia sclerotiorum 1980 UF-70]|uniref:Uncharacterized protein n=1 Tax=Sclerotinia sclerotiorum (strain ATCC 18683 / 1980 / Ss-1) TaxID=665079 RepID=A7ETZ0_SCLS1|nr:predicted protein [Sclerotinia sclerotiorum 1980 UF-70]EDN92932.1 predicted protein [Sclerotinia sclerotiorum 1980 UF-70]
MSDPNSYGLPGDESRLKRPSNESAVSNTMDDFFGAPLSSRSVPQDGGEPSRDFSQPFAYDDEMLPSSTLASNESVDENAPSSSPPEEVTTAASRPRLLRPSVSRLSSNKSVASISTDGTLQLEPGDQVILSFGSLKQVILIEPPGATVRVRKFKANILLDRQERAIAALLTRFKNLVVLAALPTEDAFAKETAAAEGLRMEVESNALTSAAEDLLKLTRELKELWIFGALREIGEGEGDGEMEADSKKVAELIEKQLEKKHEQEKHKA